MMFSAAIFMMMQAQPLSAEPAPARPPLTKGQQSWVLEYPRIIGEEVDAYYGCLKSRGVVSPIKEEPVFEAQHREHIPLCAKQLAKSLASAKSILIGRKHYEAYTPERIAAAFSTIELIHIERGRKIDQSLQRNVSQYAVYDAAYDTTPEEVSGGERIAADLPSTPQETPDAKN